MTHGHDVLHMMEGHTYATKAQLVEAIIARFGEAERFHTCHAENLFMPAPNEAFTVDTDRICHH